MFPDPRFLTRSAPVFAATVLMLAACWRTDPLYCERNSDCADVAGRPFCDVAGTYPGSEGIAQTCIADPGGNCTVDAQCTDPALPACSAGACRECGPTHACGPDQPVCDVAESTCAACTGDPDCAAFAARPHCSLDDGACVGCTSDADCAATGQACLEATRACGACTADADCESGLCDEVNRSCVAEDAILYVAAGGSGTACSKATPCTTLSFAHSLVTEARRHILVASGRYEGATMTGKSFELTGVSAMVTSDLMLDGTIVVQDIAVERARVIVRGGTVLMRRLSVTDAAPAPPEGAVQISGGTATLEDSRIERTNGIASNVNEGATFTVRRNNIVNNGLYAVGALGTVTVQDNHLVGNGSGVILVGLRQTITVVNNVIAHNDFGMYLGGNPAFAQVEHNTIVANQVGIDCADAVTSRPTFRNNILWDQDVDAETPQITSQCTTLYSIIGPRGFVAGTGNINADPRFIDAAARDYRILADSPARDAADPVLTRNPPAVPITRDIAGTSRPAGARPDIGAYELAQ